MQFQVMIVGPGRMVNEQTEWVRQQGVGCIGAHWEDHHAPLNDPIFLLERFNPSVIFIFWPLGLQSDIQSCRKLVTEIRENVCKRGLKYFPIIALMSDHSAAKAEAEFLGVRTDNNDGAGFLRILEEAEAILPEAKYGPQILIPHT
jgi:hypothetical protein